MKKMAVGRANRSDSRRSRDNANIERRKRAIRPRTLAGNVFFCSAAARYATLISRKHRKTGAYKIINPEASYI